MAPPWKINSFKLEEDHEKEEKKDGTENDPHSPTGTSMPKRPLSIGIEGDTFPSRVL